MCLSEIPVIVEKRHFTYQLVSSRPRPVKYKNNVSLIPHGAVACVNI